MRLLVGLGNIGKKFENTRHNVGFLFLDYLYQLPEVKVRKKWRLDSKNEIEVAEITYDDKRFMLIKPQTYMNDSGRAVQKALGIASRIHPEKDLLVVYDDLETALGKWKEKREGSAGGHNGIRSIIAHIGAQFPRLKVGIGRPVDITVHDYVLGPLTVTEKDTLVSVFAHIVDWLKK